MAQQVVRLGDQLHVGVFDAIVHHLDVVAGAIGADVRTAGRAVDLRGNPREDGRHMVVRLACPAGHDARSVQRAFLAARNARAKEAEPLSFQLSRSTLRVREQRVAAVDHDVAGLEIRLQVGDHVVDRLAGFHHHQYGARSRDGGHEVAQ